MRGRALHQPHGALCAPNHPTALRHCRARRRARLHSPAPQHGHSGRQSLSRYALQLLRSDLRVALGAEFRLAGPKGERVVPAARLYANDGIDYLTKQPDEILAEVRLPAAAGWDAVYHKLRRRGSFDFPVLGVAVWLKWDGRQVADARVVLGGVASLPQEVAQAGAALTGTDLSDEAISAAAEAAYRPAKPLDNTDFDLSWRKQMTRVYVKAVLAELRARRR